MTAIKHVPKVIMYSLLLLTMIVGIWQMMVVDDCHIFPERGVADTSGIDLSEIRVRIRAVNWEYYPGQLYSPEDFKAGNTITPIYENNVEPAECGTYRVTLILLPGKTYGMAGRSFLFSQRVYIGGELMDETGDPGTSAETTTPRAREYTLYFTPKTERTEIIFQVANFQMQDGGGSYSFSLGEAKLAEQYRLKRQTGAAVMVGGLIAIALLFLGMLMFFTGRKHFLYFALLNLMIAARTVMTGDKPIMEFFPSLDWYLAIRLEYLSLILIVAFTILYFHSLYPKLLPKPVVSILLGASVLYGGAVLFTEPIFFSRINSWFFILWSITGLWILIRLAMGVRGGGAERLFVFSGMLLYLLTAVNDFIQYTLPIFMWVEDVLTIGMLLFVYMNMIALSIGFSRTETELAETKQQEKKLREDNELLDKLDRMKTEFYENMSHEMRTPLTVISTDIQNADDMMDFDADKNAMRELLQNAQQEIMRLARMVNSSLDLVSRHEEQRGMSALDVAPLIRRSAEAFRHMLKANGNSLTLDVPEEPVMIHGNADMLSQLIVNLLSNAGRHTRNGTISVTLSRDIDTAIVTVRDTGVGIPSDILPRVFERGVSDGGGTGYGLHICKTVVETHGGVISILSECGKGAVVTATLPLYEERDRVDAV